MTGSSTTVPTYIKELSMEATLRSNKVNNIYFYGYVTYNKNSLHGPRIEKTKTYNIQAYGRIPITENEFVDMKLHTGKDDNVLDFHMTYVRNFAKDENALFGRRIKQPISMLNVRTDLGPHKGRPHIDVEIFDLNRNKVFDRVVRQDKEFTNYESSISAVFMQVEKISNPLIGAQYWLSPTQIFPERVNRLAELRRQYEISTSLSVVARAINLKLYEETNNGVIVDEVQFWRVVETQLELIKQSEKSLGGDLDIEGIRYSTEISALPFLFFAPEYAHYDFKAYRSTGEEIRKDIEVLGVVSEKNAGINLMRSLSADEGYFQRSEQRDSKIKDSFIIEVALPNEPIAGWIKYEQALEFEYIRISFDVDGIKRADFQLKNVGEDFHVPTHEYENGTLDIPRQNIVLDGYIGFVCAYSIIPKFEKDILFSIDFINKNKVTQSANLKTKIVRPILKISKPEAKLEQAQLPIRVPLSIAHYPQDNIWTTVSPETNEFRPEKMYVYNAGSADAKNTRLLIGSSNPNIRTELKISERVRETHEFFKETEVIQDMTLEVSGIGKSTIQYLVEYTDEAGNLYREIQKEERIERLHERPEQIPLPPIVFVSTLPIAIHS